jgi:hypothetical protein
MKEVPLYMVFVLYLVISSNFLAQLFSCRLQFLLNHSMLAKHLLGYMTLLFFIVLASNDTTYTANSALMDSFWIYLIFVVSTRTSFPYLILFLLMASILYIIHIYQTKQVLIIYDQRLETSKKILQYAMMIVLMVGFVFYLMEKKMEYKHKFSWTTFLLGRPQCKDNKPTNQVFRFMKQSVSTKR